MAGNYDGFFKVFVDGGGVEVTTFFNPETMEEFSSTTFDIDDERIENDERIWTLRHLPWADDDTMTAWKRLHGVPYEGATVEVVKGRKVKIGTVATIEKIKPYFDRYHRWQCDYAYLSTGERTNVNNCKVL